MALNFVAKSDRPVFHDHEMLFSQFLENKASVSYILARKRPLLSHFSMLQKLRPKKMGVSVEIFWYTMTP